MRSGRANSLTIMNRLSPLIVGLSLPSDLQNPDQEFVGIASDAFSKHFDQIPRFLEAIRQAGIVELSLLTDQEIIEYQFIIATILFTKDREIWEFSYNQVTSSWPICNIF